MNSGLNILFLCTGNSARSIMAEMAANDPRFGRGQLRGLSAGSFPTGIVHPMALETLARHKIATTGARSKSWDEYQRPDAVPIDVMITVCGRAAGETCPIWPGRPATAHWGVPDPAAITEPGAEQSAAFESAFQTLSARIAAFAALDLGYMSEVGRTQAAREIGVQVL